MEVFFALLVLIHGFQKNSNNQSSDILLNQTSSECPNRCNPSTDAIKPVSKALMRMYNELDVKCAHYDKCNQIVKLVDLEQHEKICQLPKCDNHEICGNFLKDNVDLFLEHIF